MTRFLYFATRNVNSASQIYVCVMDEGRMCGGRRCFVRPLLSFCDGNARNGGRDLRDVMGRRAMRVRRRNGVEDKKACESAKCRKKVVTLQSL